MTLGRYPRVTLARARTMALDALARVHVGEDPRRTAAANVADLAAAYLAEYVRPNLRSCRDVERRFKKDVLPAIGTVPLADLHKRDINRVISPIVQRGRQEQAGRVFKDLRAMLRWGVERGDLDTNPANGVRKPASRPPRERVLSDGEIAPAA
jgi:integrase